MTTHQQKLISIFNANENFLWHRHQIIVGKKSTSPDGACICIVVFKNAITWIFEAKVCKTQAADGYGARGNVHEGHSKKVAEIEVNDDGTWAARLRFSKDT